MDEAKSLQKLKEIVTNKLVDFDSTHSKQQSSREEQDDRRNRKIGEFGINVNEGVCVFNYLNYRIALVSEIFSTQKIAVFKTFIQFPDRESETGLNEEELVELEMRADEIGNLFFIKDGQTVSNFYKPYFGILEQLVRAWEKKRIRPFHQVVTTDEILVGGTRRHHI